MTHRPLLLIACLIQAGCPAQPADSPPSDSGPPDESGPCTVPDDQEEVFGPILAEPSASQPTVFTVRWSPGSAGNGWVGFGQGTEEERTSTAREAAEGGLEALLIGLAASTQAVYRVYHQTDDALYCSTPSTLTTGALDPALPRLTLTGDVPDQASGAFTLLPLCDQTGGAGCWTVILNAEAEPVWATQAGPLRAWLSLDHEALLLNDRSFEPSAAGTIQRLPLDGSQGETLSVPGAHTDFVEVEPGVYATFGWDLRAYDDGARVIAGETIMEVTAHGAPQVLWSIYDMLEPDLEREYTTDATWTTDAEIWAHLNHLHYAPDEDAYYVTSRTLAAVFRIDRATGEGSWILGQGGWDFLQQGSDPIAFDPHSAVPTDRGVLVFDTGSSLTGGCSGMSEFTLDTDAMTAEHRWTYTTEGCLVTGYLGNAALLEGGNRMLVLSMNGQLDEVTPDGELAWRVTAPGGWIFTYATRAGSLLP